MRSKEHQFCRLDPPPSRSASATACPLDGRVFLNVLMSAKRSRTRITIRGNEEVGGRGGGDLISSPHSDHRDPKALTRHTASLVVKASASRVGDPRFHYLLRSGDFPRVESPQ